jgi:hypothetical protein
MPGVFVLVRDSDMDIVPLHTCVRLISINHRCGSNLEYKFRERPGISSSRDDKAATNTDFQQG